jgi:glycosyltransferase involved in cell wall biosynthesis
MQLSAAIIARDEARHIAGCVDSLAGLADEVLVLLDDRTRDETAAICASKGARVLREPWRGFPAQRNRALSLCRAPWVLFIDADERVEPDLAAEIRATLAAPRAAGYWIPRHNRFFGQTLRGGGWYPDPQLRLLRRDAARYDEARLVHEFAQLQGEAGTLRGHLAHHNIDGLGELWRKQTAYALAQARTMAAEGRRARARNFIGAPTRELWRRYINLGGWRDGPLGLFLCATLAWFELVSFAFLLLLAPHDHTSPLLQLD